MLCLTLLHGTCDGCVECTLHYCTAVECRLNRIQNQDEMTLDTKLILYTGHNSLWSASSRRRTALRCTTLQICDHYNTIYYIRYIILYSLCRAHLKSVMASIKCSFPSCESDVSAKIVSLSESESDPLQLRYSTDMKCLCLCLCLFRSYYPHRSRELVSPICGIFYFSPHEPFL